MPRLPDRAITPAPVSCNWTWQEDKLLDLLVCRFYPRWDYIVAYLGGGKTADQVYHRWEHIVALADLRQTLEPPEVDQPVLLFDQWDVFPAMACGGEDAVDGGLPTGGDSAVAVDGSFPTGGDSAVAAEDAGVPAAATVSGGGGGRELVERKKNSIQTKNKPMPWSEDEHRQFLAAIDKYGKGRWQRISSEFVPTRSASQIASHYQKYTIRQAKRRRNECKRPSIHDISTEYSAGGSAADHGVEQAKDT